MKVLEKLMNVRLKLQTAGIKKTGRNDFAKFDYYELQDFLPQAMSLFKEEGLCPIVSFANDLATLTLYSIGDDSKVVVTSPFGASNLKGCHDIQNVGSSETYSRRYLYISLLEIVESDALDRTSGQQSSEPAQSQKPKTVTNNADGASSKSAQEADSEDDVQKWFDTIKRVADIGRLQTAENNLETFFKTEEAKKRVRAEIARRREELAQPA